MGKTGNKMRNKVVNLLNKGKSLVKSHRNLILQSVHKQSPPPQTSGLQLFMLVKVSHKELHKHLVE